MPAAVQAYLELCTAIPALPFVVGGLLAVGIYELTEALRKRKVLPRAARRLRALLPARRSRRE